MRALVRPKVIRKLYRSAPNHANPPVRCWCMGPMIMERISVVRMERADAFVKHKPLTIDATKGCHIMGTIYMH